MESTHPSACRDSNRSLISSGPRSARPDTATRLSEIAAGYGPAAIVCVISGRQREPDPVHYIPFTISNRCHARPIFIHADACERFPATADFPKLRSHRLTLQHMAWAALAR